jgi:NAD(P)-dependent dehydrogenase (short-subunit alcohol dehydrogenase family)
MRMLPGRSALIIGSLGGTGLATANAPAAQACSVILNGFAALRRLGGWVAGR